MWKINYFKKHSYIISSDSQLTNEYTGGVIIPPGISSSIEINNFSSENSDLYNTSIVDDEKNGKDISLSLSDKIVSIIIDKSGSMSWSDIDNFRYELIRRFVNRIAATYPGDISFNLFKFGGKQVGLLFSAALDSENIFDSSRGFQDCFDKDIFFDYANNLYGVRVVRNENGFPTSPIDGELVFDGNASSIFDGGLISDKTYYYKIFTFDENYNFSYGKTIKATPRNKIIPKGIKTFSHEVLKGSGVVLDDYVDGVWHFDEGKGNIVYDFTGKDDLSFSESNEPLWLNKIDVPVGTSGLRMNGTEQITTDLTGNFILNNKKTIMLWVYPFQIGTTNRVLVARRNGLANLNYVLYININKGLTFSNNALSTVSSSNNVVNENEWNFISCTIDMTTGVVDFYVNRFNVGSSILPDLSTNTGQLYLEVGYDSSGVLDGFFGKIKELSLHNSVRSQSYIASYSFPSTREDDDNGDRLVVLKYSIPNDLSLLPNRVSIVKKYGSAPYYEDDGDIFYDSQAAVGNYYITNQDNFVIGSSVNYRIFSYNLIGNYSDIEDSLNIECIIDGMSKESSQYIDPLSSSLPYPLNISIQSGNAKNFIKWSMSSYDNRIKRTRIYYSNSSYPIISNNSFEDGISGAELIYDGDDVTINEFVHRNLVNGNSYYYSIVSVDKYNRVSRVANISGIPDKNLSDIGIPLMDLPNINYNIIDNDSLKISWDYPDNYNVIRGYMDDDVVLFAKLIDQSGNSIVYDDIEISSDINAEYELDKNISEDVFIGETEFIPEDINSTYNFTVYEEDGFIKGFINIKNTDSGNTVFKNIKKLLFTVSIKISIPDKSSTIGPDGKYTSHFFEYVSKPILIELSNPFYMGIENRDNKKVEVKTSGIVTVLNNGLTTQRYFYDGAYIGASDLFVVRVRLNYKGETLDGLSKVYAVIYNSVKDIQDFDSIPQKTTINNSIILQNNGEYDVLTTSEEILDSNGNPTGVFEDISYVDIPVSPSILSENILLYIKAEKNGYCFVKNIFVVFENTLKIEINPRVPFANGIDTSEQTALVYLLDPDYPNDKSKRVYPPQNTVVKWEINKIVGDVDRSLYYAGDNNPPLTNGVYTFLENGISKDVFLGPISNAVTYGFDSDDNIQYETHELKASVFYNNIQSYDSKIINILPLYSSGHTSSKSNFLMEFDDVKNIFYADGRNYVRMTISHDPSVSNTKYSSCFRGCMSELEKVIYSLQKGQLVSIRASDSDTEIIYGDVIEYVDPYTGEWLLDTSNATVGKGHVYASLSDDDKTFIYFRINKVYNEQRSTGFEVSANNCSCLNDRSLIKYNNEILIYGDIVSLVNDEVVTFSGGGDINDGIPPTILVPREPLNVSVVGKKSNGLLVDSIVVDGVNQNDIILDVSLSNIPVPDNIKVSLSIINYIDQDSIKSTESSYRTLNYVDNDINSNNPRSYATVVLEPLQPNRTVEGDLLLSVSYDRRGSIERNRSYCLSISYDAEDAKEFSGTQSPTIFSKDVEKISLVALGSWDDSVASMNHQRGHLCAESISDVIYAIGGVDSSKITNSVESYDSSSNSWTDKSPMLTPRMNSMSVSVGNYIYIIGGLIYDQSSNSMSVSNKLERYDTVGDSWEELEDMPSIISGPETFRYGIAYGIAKHISGKIYILSGIREIAYDGLSSVYNDRILSYDIATDSWVYTDIIENIEFYQYYRISPEAFVDGDEIVIIGGVSSIDGSMTILTGGYSYDTASSLVSDCSGRFDIMPQPRYAASIVGSGAYNYIIGGIFNSTNNSRTVEKVLDTGAVINPIYTVEKIPNLGVGRNGAGSAVINIDGTPYLFSIGGIVSGKSPDFLKIKTKITPSIMTLNGKEYVESKIILEDDNGDHPQGNISMNMNGYLQYSNVLDNQENIVNSSLIKYPVKFNNNTIEIIDGEGIAVLMPRSDDWLKNISETGVINGVDGTIRYKIIVQSEIEPHESYHGRNFINIYDEDLQPITNSSVCISLHSNCIIDSLNGIFNDVNSIDILTPFLRQSMVELFDCNIDKIWIPDVENLSGNSPVSLSRAMVIIDELDDDISIGCSPLYDAVDKSSQFLSNNDYDNIDKSLYVFTDSEPNCSSVTIDNAVASVRSVNSEKIPRVIISNMDVNNPYLQAYNINGTNSPELNLISKQTGGKSYSVVSRAVESDIIKILSGVLTGSLGYGRAIYVVDLEDEYRIDSSVVYFNLPSNTNGFWTLSGSIDGYNYNSISEKFRANYEASFDLLYARYLKFDMELMSGLSISNDTSYEDVPVPYPPSILEIYINRTKPSTNYIYTKKHNLSIEPRQFVATVDTDNLWTENIEVDVGVAVSNSYHWDDFNTASQPSRKNGGKIVIPLRREDIGLVSVEPLVNLDGFMFNSTYGPWPQDSIVEIYDSNNEKINSNQYEKYPRLGYVIFLTKRNNNNYLIRITNPNAVTMGSKIINASNRQVYIYGLGYMYSQSSK